MPQTRFRTSDFLPASVLALRHYSVQTFTSDLIAGVTVGFVALPLAMAFAISSGMTPQAGIYCAIVTGFLISALGGSYVQIGGPTGAFVVVVSGIIAEHGLDGLFMCTMMAGVVLVVMGLTGTGTAVRFIPRPVVIGFTNGIALVIASTQLRDVFGIALDGPAPGDFIGRIGRADREHRQRIGPDDGGRDWRAGADNRVESPRAARARIHRRASRRDHGGGRCPTAARDDRHTLRRHPGRPAGRSRFRAFVPT